SSVVQLATDLAAGTALAVITGFTAPAAVWQLGDTATPLHPIIETGVFADGVELAVSHVEYPSLDGTAIGLFLIHRADIEPSPDTPAILNGYGGFAITETPMFSPTIAAWCEAGGLYAIAGLRGGLEHGEEWHQ